MVAEEKVEQEIIILGKMTPRARKRYRQELKKRASGDYESENSSTDSETRIRKKKNLQQKNDQADLKKRRAMYVPVD